MCRGDREGGCVEPGTHPSPSRKKYIFFTLFAAWAIECGTSLLRLFRALANLIKSLSNHIVWTTSTRNHV
jgi:hypothetical protein